MSLTPNLGLVPLAAGQAQKHVAVNDALALLDSLVHLSVVSRAVASPPAGAPEGARYLVPMTGAGGAFAGQAGRLARVDGGAWDFRDPRPGWRLFVQDEGALVLFDGAAWRDFGALLGNIDRLARLGIGTAADATNRFALKANAALLAALTAAEGGDGSLRVKLSKEAPAGTVSQVYQSGYSGRAEVGLAGDDRFRVRVSADGAAWRDALVVEPGTGLAAFPLGLSAPNVAGGPSLLINGDLGVNGRVFAGGALAAGAYGYDRWKAGAGGCAVSRAAGGVVTLTGPLEQVVEAALWAPLAGAASLAGLALTLSVEDPSGPVPVVIGATGATIPAGAGRRSATVTLGAGETGNVTVRLAPAAATTFRRAKLEVGALATPWAAVPADAERARCARYYAKTMPAGVAPVANAGLAGALVSFAVIANAIAPGRWAFPVPMRAPPSLTFLNPSAAGAGWSVGGADAGAAPSVPVTAESAVVVALTTPSIGAGIATFVHAVASAEL